MAISASITIRPLEEEDFTDFLNIQRDALFSSPEIFGSDYDWFDQLSLLSKEQRYGKYMNFPYRYLLGAFDDEKGLVGMIGFSSENTSAKLRHKGRTWGMFVRSNFRGAGLASALVDSVVRTASESGCELVQLSVGVENRDSYALYLRKGFTVYGTEFRAMKVDDRYVDEYLMVKILQ